MGYGQLDARGITGARDKGALAIYRQVKRELGLATAADAATCRHCGRTIVPDGEAWIDPNAVGDDGLWRETCDSHDTFTAEHEPF